MKLEDFENLTNSIKDKLGEENSAKIADDLAKLITDNNQMNKTLESKDNEITKLKEDKDLLQQTNMNLLQQIPMGEESKPSVPEDNKPKFIDFREGFDEKGNFKH